MPNYNVPPELPKPEVYDAHYREAMKTMNEEESMECIMFTIMVYLDDGRIYQYKVESASKAREHAAAIAEHGYRHNDGETFEHYPAWRVLKVKVIGGIPSHYFDEATGT